MSPLSLLQRRQSLSFFTLGQRWKTRHQPLHLSSPVSPAVHCPASCRQLIQECWGLSRKNQAEPTYLNPTQGASWADSPASASTEQCPGCGQVTLAGGREDVSAGLCSCLEAQQPYLQTLSTGQPPEGSSLREWEVEGGSRMTQVSQEPS